MKEGYITWFMLALIYILFSGLFLFGAVPGLLFFTGQYQVLRKEMRLQENKRTYIFLLICLTALVGVPFLNGTMDVREGWQQIMNHAVGIGSFIYVCLFYCLQKYFLTYNNATEEGKTVIPTLVDKLVMFIPVVGLALLFILKFTH